MTTLITQQSGSDCVLACIAMAKGATAWADVWTQDDLEKVIKSRGISPFDYNDWGAKAGIQFDYCNVWKGADQDVVKFLLRGQQAILSVNSLNIDGGSHAIYWDGKRIWDPNEGIEGKLAFKYLSSVTITCINRVKTNGEKPIYTIPD